MKKILIFCSDLLPLPGLPTSGGGLRSWQFIKGLEHHGMDVDYRLPQVRFLTKKFLPIVKKKYENLLWTPDNQNQLIDSVHPDVVIFMNPEQMCIEKQIDIPIVIDLHGSRISEIELSSGQHGDTARASFLAGKLSKLARADFITCAGNRQKYYFTAYLVMAGLPIDQITISTIPVSLSPEMPKKNDFTKDKKFIFAGGIYPWQSPIVYLEALVEILKNENNCSLELFGGLHNINNKHNKKVTNFINNIQKNKFVCCHGYTERGILIEKYTKSYAAIDIMPFNLERDLAFTTRTIEYMWSGLPVVYNNYSELSEFIKFYDAGWCLDPDNIDSFRECISAIIASSSCVGEKGMNAQRLVKENFTWDQTIKPLLDFCKNPHKRNIQQKNFVFYQTNSIGPTILERLFLEYQQRGGNGFLKFCSKKIINRFDNRKKNG